jgi:hypothetical protein
MSNYSSYPYGRLLAYIDNGCQRIGEERDFVQYLITMDEVDSIEALVKRYNNIFKFLAVIFFGTNKLPDRWYVPETWGYNHEYLVDELNLCFNEKIWSWFNKQDSPTSELCIKCIANLRDGENYISMKNLFLKSYADNDADIIQLIATQHRHYKLIKKLELDRNYSKPLKGQYIQSCKVLAWHGRVFDIVEKSLGKTIDVTYDDMAELYQKELELEAKRKKEIERNAKKRRREKLIRSIIIGVLTISIGLLFMIIIDEIGIFGIIIMIGFIGAIPKLFLTGKL